MKGRWRNHIGWVSVLGIVVLFLMIGLRPLAAQEAGGYPGESPTAPVAWAPGPEQPAAEQKAAEEDKPTFNAGSDVLSQYVWRGFALSRNSAVVQPSATLGYKGFSLNVWGNFDTSERAPSFITNRKGAYWNETDFTAGYTRDIFKSESWLKTLTLNVGCIFYLYDRTIYPQGNSFEVYYGLVADFNIFKIGAQANTEVFHYPGNWLTIGISRVFELPWDKATLEVGNNYVFLFSRDQATYPYAPFSNPTSNAAFNGPLSGQVYATLTIPVGKYVTIAPKGGFWYALGGNSTQVLRFGSWDSRQNHAYGGVNVSLAF